MINPPKPYYTPRRYPASAIMAVSCQVVLAALLVIAATYFIAPMHRGTNIAGPQEIWADLHMDDIRLGFQARLMALSLAGALGGAMAGLLAWRRTPRSEPFSQIDGTEPQVFYDGEARDVLQRRLFAEAGAKAERGLYLAPHLAMPRDAELKNVLVVGAPNSGKSHIIRALADQAIERGKQCFRDENLAQVAVSIGTSRSIRAKRASTLPPHRRVTPRRPGFATHVERRWPNQARTRPAPPRRHDVPLLLPQLFHQGAKTDVFVQEVVSLTSRARGQAAVLRAPPIERARRDFGGTADLLDRRARSGFSQQAEDHIFGILGRSHRRYPSAVSKGRVAKKGQQTSVQSAEIRPFWQNCHYRATA